MTKIIIKRKSRTNGKSKPIILRISSRDVSNVLMGIINKATHDLIHDITIVDEIA